MRYLKNHFKKPISRSGVYAQKSTPDGRIKNNFEHILIAEAVLGRQLPEGAQVHHFDGDRRNNAHANLVICQDVAYHKLLHVRQKCRDAGGDPNTQKVCCTCRQPKAFSEFGKFTLNKSTGLQSACRSCCAMYRARRSERERLAVPA